MVTFPRLVGTPLIYLAFFSLALGSQDSTVVVTMDVIALREAVPAMSDGKDINTVVNFLAPLQMRVIGENDGTWRRDNPNWAPVLHLVSEDLKRDLEPVLKAQAADGAARWNRELAADLTPAQIGQLLAFYRSDTGQRYLAFQKRLIAVQAEGSSVIMTAMASGGVDPTRAAEPEPSAAQLEHVRG